MRHHGPARAAAVRRLPARHVVPVPRSAPPALWPGACRGRPPERVSVRRAGRARPTSWEPAALLEFRVLSAGLAPPYKVPARIGDRGHRSGRARPVDNAGLTIRNATLSASAPCTRSGIRGCRAVPRIPAFRPVYGLCGSALYFRAEPSVSRATNAYMPSLPRWTPAPGGA